MGVNKSAVSVSTTATKIVSANNRRVDLVISNEGSATIYLGFDDTVTTSNGVSLYQSEKTTWSGKDIYRGDIYGIVASGTQEARYWEAAP